MMLTRPVRTIIFSLLIPLLACNLAFAEHRCRSSIVIRNPSGGQRFGAVRKDLPDGRQLSIVPRALAIDSKGDIYVGDSVNYRILKFSGTGRFLLEFKLQPMTSATPRDTGPVIQDLAVDAVGNVHAWNLYEKRIEIYDQNGKFRDSVSSSDESQRLFFSKMAKGGSSKYLYVIDPYVPRSKRPGLRSYSITVSSVSGKRRKVVAKCYGAPLDRQEDGLIYSFDFNGHIYTFDANQNVIRIDPFK